MGTHPIFESDFDCLTEMQFLRSVISGSRAMRVLPSIGPVAETHTVLAENSMFDFPDNTKSAIFGMGCFWGVERLFYNQKGIYSTQSGYAGGVKKNPTYEETCQKLANGQHAEVVRVVYHPDKITYEDLLKVFWENHDPTQGNRAGNDIGPQYRSAIYCSNEEELEMAKKTKELFQQELIKNGTKKAITTEIKIETEFFYAEDYHQQYLHKNPWGYCGLKGTGVTCPMPPKK